MHEHKSVTENCDFQKVRFYKSSHHYVVYVNGNGYYISPGIIGECAKCNPLPEKCLSSYVIHIPLTPIWDITEKKLWQSCPGPMGRPCITKNKQSDTSIGGIMQNEKTTQSTQSDTPQSTSSDMTIQGMMQNLSITKQSDTAQNFPILQCVETLTLCDGISQIVIMQGPPGAPAAPCICDEKLLRERLFIKQNPCFPCNVLLV